MRCVCIKRLHIAWWWRETSGSSRQGRARRAKCYILKPIAQAFSCKPNKACITILTGLMSFWNESVRDYVCQEEEGEMSNCHRRFVRSTGADNEQRGDRGRVHQKTNLDANPRTATRFQGTEQQSGKLDPFTKKSSAGGHGNRKVLKKQSPSTHKNTEATIKIFNSGKRPTSPN